MSIQDDIQKAIANKEMYDIGDIVPESWQQAYETYMQLAKSGDAKAQFNLGYMFARGDLMERDLGKACEWYQKAAEKDDSRAHYNLSQLYEQGEFAQKNSIKAKQHMVRAIELGDKRATSKAALANAKEALKLGDRDKARTLFASIAASSKEAEMGIIACDVVFKSLYNTSIVYSYHSSGAGSNKKFWKTGESVKTEVDLAMTNQSAHSWHVLVKALTSAGDGVVHIATFGGVLKAGETQSNIIDPEKYAASVICGVSVYSDIEGSVDKPSYLFHFPDVPILPDKEERKNLPGKIQKEKAEMERQNKTAKPKGCFVLTACYGSYDAPTVLAFRQFRDNHLSRYKTGRAFISWYYTHGPSWAQAIDNKPGLKAFFRAVFNQLAKILPK